MADEKCQFCSSSARWHAVEMTSETIGSERWWNVCDKHAIYHPDGKPSEWFRVFSQEEGVDLPSDLAREIRRRVNCACNETHTEALMSGFPNLEQESDEIADETKVATWKYWMKCFREQGRLS